ncbi:hypothetical protein DYBT9623_04469 [Dyadobacter sp. CECT 9623]|uniref:VWFA domain-containing protein n=1 Tax=Dyadobacter linearis TaxID=2823330 RepID=A0ABM8UW13_9BACT|nr:VWA domain-containing protein [Dyadobacter sp. CECT 9623]CAG5072933.1 hypothetical protein DYBT9623_04469 [Dyadobacter sp. CECT 9623]
MSKNWICVNDSQHVFDAQTAASNGYFCPTCAYGEGILVEGGSVTSQATSDLGLCIMVLDCSGSMNDAAFQNSPISKNELVARSVTAGIYSLIGNSSKEFAYMLIIGFDHEIDILLPFTNLETIFRDYPESKVFEQELLSKMKVKGGATDINEALKIAFNFTQQFINSSISSLGNYAPRVQSVMDNNFELHNIPNVRVLLFTDGGQYTTSGERILPSPFKDLSFDGKNFDLLMSAYYGEVGEKGYSQLLSLSSKCPSHFDTDQFFLFDDPKKVANLKGLFRMASGASGFCPKCLEEANTVTTDNRQ